MATPANSTGGTTRRSYNFVHNRADAPSINARLQSDPAGTGHITSRRRFRPIGSSVDDTEREGLAMFAGALALRLEGIVAKDAKSRYVEGRLLSGIGREIKSRAYQRQEKIEFHPRKSE